MSIRVDQPSIHRANRLADLFAPAIVDVFAGLGGWSIGEEQAFVDGGYRDRYVDLMVNHWDVAVGVHQVNHPMTQHLHCDVREVDPGAVLPGRQIVHAHFSPDCTDHSKAKGGKPRRKEIRALADVVIVWAGKRRPRVITLENVEEFAQWGPLLKNGQPDKRRRGAEFARWVGELEDLGYVVEWRELRACDYGAPTTRKRLYVIARCDGEPIVWPEKTHGSKIEIDLQQDQRLGNRRSKEGAHLHRVHAGRPRQGACGDSTLEEARIYESKDSKNRRGSSSHLKPYRTAAECIDWPTPMLSIFATRPEAREWARGINAGRDRHDRVGVPQRPLKLNTQKRLAGGLWKWALTHGDPFIVQLAHGGDGGTWNDGRASGADAPLGTIHAGGNNHAVADVEVVPFTAGVGGRAGQSAPSSADVPLPTVTGKADRAVAAAYLASPAHSKTTGRGRYFDPLDAPIKTTTSVNDKAIVSAQLAPFTVPRYGERDGQAPRSGSVEEPLPTVTPTDSGARLVAASVVKHYGGPNGHMVIGHDAREPFDAVTGRDHNGLLAAHLVKFRGDSVGNFLADPVPTVTSGAGAKRDAGAAHAMGLACVYLSHMYTSNTCGGQGDPRQPLKTITSGGQHGQVAVVYLAAYYGSDYCKPASEPMPTVTGHDRFGLAHVEATPHWILTPAALRRAKQVATWARRMLGAKVDRFILSVRDEAGAVFKLLTMTVRGAVHLVTDILMRMLKPRELARAQGFDDSYVIDRTIDGQRISKADQVKLIGNSVCAAVARAIVKANIVDMGLLDDDAALKRARDLVCA